MGEYIKTFVHQKHTDHMHTQGRHNGCSSRNPLPDPKGFNYKFVPVYTIEREETLTHSSSIIHLSDTETPRGYSPRHTGKLTELYV